VKFKVSFSPQSELDLLGIYDYIAERSYPSRAAVYIERIKDFCLSFSTFPARGMQRDDLEPGLRVTGFERRVTIAFHIEEKDVVIDRILYAGRSLEKAFDDDE
jgi:toxin ParE1/3/4